MANLNEIWDPVGAPQHGTLTPEVAEWVAGGQRVRDRLTVLEMCVRPGQGADGEIIRNSDVLRSAGLKDVVQGVKLRLEDGLLRQIVLYMPQGETKASFCGRFRAVLEEIEVLERPETPQCP